MSEVTSKDCCFIGCVMRKLYENGIRTLEEAIVEIDEFRFYLESESK